MSAFTARSRSHGELRNERPDKTEKPRHPASLLRRRPRRSGQAQDEGRNPRGTKADAQRKLREPLTALDQGDAPEPADITLSQFGPALVQALESRVGQNLGPRTVNLVHVILSGSFRYAARLELIHRNPVSLVSPPPAKRKDVMPPDILAVRHALELARGDGHDLYPAMHLIASYTGLRRGEALVLQRRVVW